VTDDPVALLERELVRAARRRAAAGPVPDALPWPRARRRRIRVGDALSAAAAAGAVIVALAALALLGRGGGGHPASTAAASPRDRLVATLAVLRRPQTSADLGLPELSRAHTNHPAFRPMLGTPDRPLIRLASTAPWGAKVYLVPFRPLARRRIPSGWTAYAPLRVRSHRGEAITVLGGPGGHGSTLFGFTAADIAQGRAVVDESGNGHARHAIRFLVVVPDGVAKVAVAVTRGPRRTKNATIEKVLFDEAVPRGNVVAFQQLGAKPATPWGMTWLTARGKVIKRISLPADLG